MTDIVDRIREALSLPDSEALAAIRAMVAPPTPPLTMQDTPSNPTVITPLAERRADFLKAANLDTGTPTNTPDNRPATVFGLKPKHELTQAQLDQIEIDRKAMNAQSEQIAKQFRKGAFE